MADVLEEIAIVLRGDTSHLRADFQGAANIMSNLINSFTPGGIATGLATIGSRAVGVLSPIALLEAGMQKWSRTSHEAAVAAEEQARADSRLRAALIATNHAVGMSFEEMKEHASELQLATGVGSSAIEEFQVKMLSFGNVQQDVFKRATHTAIEMSQMMGTDLRGAAVTLGRALENPTRGLQILARQNMIVTDEQKKSVQQFMRQGEIAKAQGVILDIVSKKYGNFAEANMSAMKKIRVEVEQLKEELGLLSRDMTMGPKLHGEKFWVTFQLEATKTFSQAGAMFAGALGPQLARQMNHVFSNLGTLAAKAWADSLLGGMGTLLKASRLTGLLYDFMLGQIPDMQTLRERALEIFGMGSRKSPHARPKPGDINMPPTKGMDGIFDPVSFQRQVQEGMLSKNDKLIALAQDQKTILGNIYDELAGGSAADPGFVATQ